jgi:hypothetical protein
VLQTKDDIVPQFFDPKEKSGKIPIMLQENIHSIPIQLMCVKTLTLGEGEKFRPTRGVSCLEGQISTVMAYHCMKSSCVSMPSGAASQRVSSLDARRTLQPHKQAVALKRECAKENTYDKAFVNLALDVRRAQAWPGSVSYNVLP